MIAKVITAGIKTSNARATPGGTVSGIFNFNPSTLRNAQKISTETTPTIIPVNKPVAPKAPPATPVNVCNAPSAVNSNVCLAVLLMHS